jgi:hypothetical protein
MIWARGKLIPPNQFSSKGFLNCDLTDFMQIRQIAANVSEQEPSSRSRNNPIVLDFNVVLGGPWKNADDLYASLQNTALLRNSITTIPDNQEMIRFNGI